MDRLERDSSGRRFQFSIWHLLILTVVVAAICAVLRVLFPPPVPPSPERDFPMLVNGFCARHTKLDFSLPNLPSFFDPDVYGHDGTKGRNIYYNPFVCPPAVYEKTNSHNRVAKYALRPEEYDLDKYILRPKIVFFENHCVLIDRDAKNGVHPSDLEAAGYLERDNSPIRVLRSFIFDCEIQFKWRNNKFVLAEDESRCGLLKRRYVVFKDEAEKGTVVKYKEADCGGDMIPLRDSRRCLAYWRYFADTYYWFVEEP